MMSNTDDIVHAEKIQTGGNMLETVADILKSCDGPREEAWDATE
jgi:hypothetical protein